MANLYRIATHIIAPFIPLWLEMRRLRGKEDKARGHERLGYASIKRPTGTVLWLHAASVGEANSVLHLITLLHKQYPDIHVLLTTGTVTSATLMETKLPKGAMHQYVPVDTPAATARFMRHWRPDIAFWVESEFWPNLITEAASWHAYMGILNGRMSEKSFRGWNKRRAMIKHMLNSFDICFAQSKADGQRLTALGAPPAECQGNLKYDAAPLPCNEEALITLKKQLGKRPIWLAASTHPGEEKQIAAVHDLLSATRPDLLTIIVPRHPVRGPQLRSEFDKKYGVTLRSAKEPLTTQTQIYIADTLGELGLFYRLCDIVFMGGSLVPHGGQNPLEPARLSCAILTGPHTYNFVDVYSALEHKKAVVNVDNAQDLAAQLSTLLAKQASLSMLQKNAKALAEDQTGTAQKILDRLAPALNVKGNT